MKIINNEHILEQLEKYCGYTERCISDIRKQMYRWKIPLNKQEKIIQRLKKENFLNEERYCQIFINRKIRRNNFQGIHKIKYELEQKKISQNLIQQALSRINLQEIREQLKKLLENKRKTIKGNTDYEINQKLTRFAYQRGFPIEDIEFIIKNSQLFQKDMNSQ